MDLRNSQITHAGEGQDNINIETLVWISMPQLPQCKFIVIFAVTWNRYFYRRYESHFKLVGTVSVLNINIHVFEIKSGCSNICNINLLFKKKNKKSVVALSVLLFRLCLI